MTIDYIVRVAEDIYQPNEIANFNSLGIARKNNIRCKLGVA
ncbi:hypothetical protein [Dickeya sp. DW 0440]|nr:hypothetical protein [Dickeya sp. DW 0440]